jgi:Lipase (class 3)
VLILDSAAPTYKALRPMKPSCTPTFPVYADLATRLAMPTAHPDDVVAHVLATCAGYAYAQSDVVAMIMARMGLRENRCRMIAETVDAMFICSTAFLVQSNDGRVVILAYRGTEPTYLINWLTDADVYPDRIDIPVHGDEQGVEVHGGFYRNVRATRYEVIAALQRALNGEWVVGRGGPAPHRLEALYITGHSLGAAMAALMGLMLVTDDAYAPIARTLRAVYTFGQPMIGGPSLATVCDADDFLGRNVVRYVYRRDVIPHLPPRECGRFKHFGPEYRYLQRAPWVPADRPCEQMTNLIGLVEAPLAFVAKQLPWLRHVPFQYSLDDHGPQHYVSALTPPGVPTEFGDARLAGQA